MRLVQYLAEDGTPRAGEQVGKEVYALNAAAIDIISGAAQPTRGALVPNARLTYPLTPPQILCIGRNYLDHINELKNAVPSAPLIFGKLTTSLIADGETIRWRRSQSSAVDWEGELVVVIGKTARNISEAEVYDYIYGYTIANDVSARDVQNAESQWLRAKSMDTFCPLGPAIVTRDEIPNPHALTLITKVNEEVMQQSSTELMMRQIPLLVSYLSHAFTLLPGAIILTGTPGGVGSGMTPPRYMEDGYRVSVTIEPIGTLSNVCSVSD